LLVYISAWEKVHFPAHFCCALINSQPMGFYSPSSLIRDAQKHGVEVRPVRVEASHWDCSLEAPARSTINSRFPAAHRALRLGFRLIKGFKRASSDALLEARTKGPFSDLSDFMRRTQLGPDQLQLLAEAGALESLVEGRRHALWATRAPRSPGLFAERSIIEERIDLPTLAKNEQLILDYDRVGLSIDDHPLRHLRSRLRKWGVVTARQLEDIKHESPVRVAGLVLARQRPATASGVVFMTLEDETGTVNLVLFSKIFERFGHTARHASLLLAEGRLERQVTQPRPGEVGRATAVIHVIASSLRRLDGPSDISVRSRDFH
jgi:error-prone DNA polymerase